MSSISGRPITRVRLVPARIATHISRVVVVLALWAATCAVAVAQVPPFVCGEATVPFVPTVRAEGQTELLGDIVLKCTGGAPTTAGNPVPAVNFTIFLNASNSGAIRATGGSDGNLFTEVLMLFDEPNSPLQNPVHPVLNCGNLGASDQQAPGTCSIVSSGNPAGMYDGTPNGYFGGVCDGVGGRPTPNSPGCGRPNVFQARLGTPQNPSQSNAVSFIGVPLDPPGTTTTRTIRITNLRVNAAEIGTSLYSSAQVIANIAVNGPTTVSIAQPQLLVGNVSPGLTAATAGALGTTSPVRVSEGFPSAWKTKNLSATVGNGGVSGNATFQSNAWVYNGGTNYPADVAQNVPGAIYTNESGFQWRNNVPNGPPSPNPPPGFGLPPAPDAGNPLNSIGFGGINTGINLAGTADSATRVAVRFDNLPSGASVQLPQVLYLFKQGTNHNGNPAQFQPGATGAMVLTNTDVYGAGPFLPGTGTLAPGNKLAVYEVVYSDTSSLEYTDVPFTILDGGQSAVQLSVGFAPMYPVGAAGPIPIPRFIDRPAPAPCTTTVCLTAFPNQGTNPDPAPPSQMVCATSVSVAPIIRAEGLSEAMGDIVLSCTGGTPTPAGQVVPQADITVSLNGPASYFGGGIPVETNVTSKLTNGPFAEALLLVDEPNSPLRAPLPPQPLLNCGMYGAPDNGGFGPGSCSIFSPGNPAQTYDGVSNGYGSALCDGAGGRPSQNTYGCGRPNAFQGRIGAHANAITFLKVPLDPPGPNTNRTLRITNVRVNAAQRGASLGFYTSQIQASISAAGVTAPFISNPQVITAFVNRGITSTTSDSRVRFSESFSSSWKTKNLSATVGNGGVPGNASLVQFYNYWVFNGGTNYPADVAQNVPGTVYSTEALFQFQNNHTNAPPSPNPPPGFGFQPIPENFGTPLVSGGLGGLNTRITNAGVADSATRLALRFANIPQGASVQIPQQIYIYRQGSNYALQPNPDPVNSAFCTAQNGCTGVMRLTATDASGAGPYSPTSATLTSSNNLAVYEILYTDPFTLELLDVPFTVQNAPPNFVPVINTGFAPFYSTTAASLASSTLPVPRFLDALGYVPCVSGPCITIFPADGTNTGSVDTMLSGGPILNGAQVKLSGAPEIPATNLSNPSPASLTARFNITGATPGVRDVIITPQTGAPFSLPGAFTIKAPPPCSWQVGPQNPFFTAGGGSADLVVTSSRTDCAWSASTATPWITLLPKTQPTIQPYTVAANPTASQRQGTISIAGQNITVTQAGACTYDISPVSQIFAVNGGDIAVDVTAPAGCPWTATSNALWITVTGGASGSGIGIVTLHAGANADVQRSGTVTIAGKTFTATQNSTACGAADVSSQVTVTRGAFASNFTATNYVQQVRLTNQTGATIPGPIYLVVDGVPLSTAPCVGGTCQISPPPALTYCGSPNGSSLVYAANGLTPGQNVNLSLIFTPGRSSGGVPPTWTTTRVFRGAPNQ